ncbi:MAG: CDP-diacylglycerol--serine O-phosphatidyltransferase [Epsilonproteobacteria bacterium]|nr:CDP-diacylglycerol--serine O-phosphatidyltransferase [Campylobacterota bacterium]
MKRTIYLFPNLFTAANLMAGFYSIIFSFRGRFFEAAIAVALAVVFDNLDGKIARLISATSRFGFEYDSLSDLVSFGVAPAILFYGYFYSFQGDLGIVISAIYLLAGSLRLAKFNVTSQNDRFFGLPIPGGALVVVSMILLSNDFSLLQYKVVALVMMFVTSYLMISNIRYEGFKHVNITKRLSMYLFAITATVIILVIMRPKIAIPAITFVYAASGPVIFLAKLTRRKIRNYRIAQKEGNNV